MIIFDFIRDYGLIVFSIFIFYFIEKKVHLEKQSLKNITFNVINLLITGIIFSLFLIYINTPFFVYLFQKGFVLKTFSYDGNNLILNILCSLFFLFIIDIIHYVLHRLCHEVPFLWETHKFHHSDRTLNSSTLQRQHITSRILFFWVYLIPLSLLQTSTLYWFNFFIFNILSYFNHINAKFSFGKLTPLISGPQVHRIHHSILPEHHNKNFAGVFPFIDIIFGTYYQPEKDEYPPTGIEGETHDDIWTAQIYPFKAWAGMWMKMLVNLNNKGKKKLSEV
jgi:sterol desaturase/sphingolipid hydroxylase (fatty acid hydroxylase superfamily)